MTLGEFEQLGIELELAGPSSLRVVSSSQPITPEVRTAIVDYLPGLLAELKLRERGGGVSGGLSVITDKHNGRPRSLE